MCALNTICNNDHDDKKKQENKNRNKMQMTKNKSVVNELVGLWMILVWIWALVKG